MEIREKVTIYVQTNHCALKLLYIAKKANVPYGKLNGLAKQIPYRDLSDEEIERVDKLLTKMSYNG